MGSGSLTIGMFLSQAIPLTVATAIIAYLCATGVLESWLARIGWSLVLGVTATLIMYSLHTGTLSVTGGLWEGSGQGIPGLFFTGLKFLALYFTIAGVWMVLGCLVVGIIAGILFARSSR